MATPRPARGHAVDQLHPHRPVAVRQPGAAGVLARGLVLGATATLALTLLPGTAAADPVFHYSPVSHVSMYIGNGQMVHASTSGQPVEVVSVDSMDGTTATRRIAG
ncbi:NlpC/P60 family protein [Geodermatophilus obscurus]|uniref:NlpC/P60 family protein n=1 Tax=Geodermatophilus obscurus TaxID=1861 RepID=UPI00019B8177